MPARSLAQRQLPVALRPSPALEAAGHPSRARPARPQRRLELPKPPARPVCRWVRSTASAPSRRSPRHRTRPAEQRRCPPVQPEPDRALPLRHRRISAVPARDRRPRAQGPPAPPGRWAQMTPLVPTPRTATASRRREPPRARSRPARPRSRRARTPKARQQKGAKQVRTDPGSPEALRSPSPRTDDPGWPEALRSPSPRTDDPGWPQVLRSPAPRTDTPPRRSAGAAALRARGEWNAGAVPRSPAPARAVLPTSRRQADRPRAAHPWWRRT